MSTVTFTEMLMPQIHANTETGKNWLSKFFLNMTNFKSEFSYLIRTYLIGVVVGNFFITIGQKRVVIFVVGHTHIPSKGTHNILPY